MHCLSRMPPPIVRDFSIHANHRLCSSLAVPCHPFIGVPYSNAHPAQPLLFSSTEEISTSVIILSTNPLLLPYVLPLISNCLTFYNPPSLVASLYPKTRCPNYDRTRIWTQVSTFHGSFQNLLVRQSISQRSWFPESFLHTHFCPNLEGGLISPLNNNGQVIWRPRNIWMKPCLNHVQRFKTITWFYEY